MLKLPASCALPLTDRVANSARKDASRRVSASKLGSGTERREAEAGEAEDERVDEDEDEDDEALPALKDKPLLWAAGTSCTATEASSVAAPPDDWPEASA